VIEYFIGCPVGQNNAVTRQSSQLSRNESQLNSLLGKYESLKMTSLMQNAMIKANGQQAKNLTDDVMKEKDQMISDLGKLDKNFGGGGKHKDLPNLDKLGQIMEKSSPIST
jgi:hypothetical protein